MTSAINRLDFYKSGHGPQYPEGTEYVYAGWTPRSTKYAETEKITVFGHQAAVLNFLIKDFDDTFFLQPVDKVVKSYARRMDNALGKGAVGTEHIRALHKLGYLPLRIKSLPEGVKVSAKIPTLTIINTQPEFFWLTNYLESALSGYLWLPATSASIAGKYFDILKAAAERTGTPPEFVPLQGHDFSMRGMYGDAASASGAGHLAAGFIGTDSVTAIDFLEELYGANSDKELVGVSVPATEHSVMCMGTQGDEIGTFSRLLDMYPAGIVSIVSDTWDLWKVLTEYAPALKEKIRARKPINSYEYYTLNNDECAGELQLAYNNGFRVVKTTDDKGVTEYVALVLEQGVVKLGGRTMEPPVTIVPGKTVFRPDSGDPVKIITGYKVEDTDAAGFYSGMSKYYIREYLQKAKPDVEAIKLNGVYWDLADLNKELKECEVKGVVEVLWDEFGGEINDKGFKQLVEVGAIYGDSITLTRAQQIVDRLADKGFASGNIVLGIGAFTYQYNTRDTYGFAMKATWGQVNGEGRDIFKDPVTDDGVKKSAKGLMRVELEDGEYVLYDQQTKEQEAQGELQVIYEDGIAYNLQTLAEIRERATA